MRNKNMSLLKMSNLTESLNRKYRLDESYSTNGITLDKMKSDIQKAKNKLKKQKPRENFGMKEIRKIEDKYSPLQLDYYSDYSRLINEFNDWCMNYTFNESLAVNEEYGEDKYSLVGQDGNAFALMGYTARCMKECGLRDEIDEMRNRATESDYDNLIMVCDEYVQRCNDIARNCFEEALKEDFDLPIDHSGEFAGWIAQYQGNKIEIDKSEADGIYGAKQLAIKKLKVPKSKEGLLSIQPGYNYNESLSAKKVVGKTWGEFVTNVENETEYAVDAAYKNRPEDWIILIDNKGNMYDAEVTKYYRGGYELMLYNVTPQR